MINNIINFLRRISHISTINRETGSKEKEVEDTKELIETNVLIDISALDNNYISIKCAKKLVKKGGIIKGGTITINSAFNNNSHSLLGSLDISIILYNEVNIKTFSINFNCLIIDSIFDLIIGKPTIKKYNLLLICKGQIENGFRITNNNRIQIHGRIEN
jgi:hypothetical protein